LLSANDRSNDQRNGINQRQNWKQIEHRVETFRDKTRVGSRRENVGVQNALKNEIEDQGRNWKANEKADYCGNVVN